MNILFKYVMLCYRYCAAAFFTQYVLLVLYLLCCFELLWDVSCMLLMHLLSGGPLGVSSPLACRQSHSEHPVMCPLP